MDQVRAINALEPFILLAKSATSARAASDLITQATSAPNTFVFAELLQTPNIQALAVSAEYASSLRLLEIFAWGTWQDYQASAASLPTLSSAQHQKLLLLSLLPLASQHTPLTYSKVQHALGLASSAAVEQLLITAIYSEVLEAKLDPQHQAVRITSIAPLRDLSPGSVPDLTSTFSTWAAQCDAMLLELQRQMSSVQDAAWSKAEREQRVERILQDRYDSELNSVKTRRDPKEPAEPLQENEAMEIDVGEDGKSKRRGFGHFPGMGRRLG
jgi:COP9 signalosome complex subunit 7